MKNYLILLVAVVLISAVQIIVKHRLNVQHGEVPYSGALFGFLLQLMKDPYLWIAGFMLISAAVLWYAGVSRTSLGVAFTFAGLSYPLVMAGSYWFLQESFVLPQMFGCALIVTGVMFVAAFS